MSKTTPETDDGGYDAGVYYLDRQYVDCGDSGVMTKFQLRRGPSGSTIYYSFSCCTGSWLTSEVVSQTSMYQDGSRHYYLDRNAVSCTYPYMLKSFHLERNGDQTYLWRWNYSCQKAEVDPESTCSQVKTDYEDSGDGIWYLDRLVADCSGAGPDYVMKDSWRLIEYDAGRTRYWQLVSTCCKAILASPSSRFDYSTIRLQSQDSSKCVTWSDAKSAGGYYPAMLGDCNASTGTLWYVQPASTSASDTAKVRLFPYPPVADSTFYLQHQAGGILYVGVSAPQSSGLYIDDGT